MAQNGNKKVGEAVFLAAYGALNASQREAVDAIEGPVMVIAGPGTGKTQILTLRIANILRKTDIGPEGILALTFTESGAKAMRERLRSYIGAESYRVPIYTFHGFAAKLISEYPESYDRVIGGRPASDLEKIKLIETILGSAEVKKLRPIGNPAYYVPHVLRIIGQLKQEYITPDELVKIINGQEVELSRIEQIHQKGAHKGKVRGEYTKKEEAITKNRELLFVYRRYEALLSEQKLFDFEDMIVETVKALQSDENMLRDLQERYQYILADEHQDVNGSQNKILELLASFHDSPNIFAVGDEKQAIYRFQGASLENFLYFTEQFRGTHVIELTDNYRSGQPVLDAAHSLVAVEDGPLKRLRVPLEAKAVAEGIVQRRNFSHEAVENEWLVDSVEEKLKQGVAASEIAVIVRTNKEVEAVAMLLRKAGLMVAASADGDILRHPITQAVEGLINLVIADKSETALFNILHGAYWNIEANDLLRVFAARSYSQSLWHIISNEAELLTSGVSDPAPFRKVVRVVSEARRLEVHEAPHRVLEYLLQESGLMAHLIEHDAFEGTRVVRRLYDEIESMVSRDGVGSLREVSEALATRGAYGLPLNAPYVSVEREAVQVMTAHKSKGLEFEVVYIPHVHDAAWSGASKKTFFEIPLPTHSIGIEHEYIEDERRLLYVAMTRAKKILSLSSSGMSSHGKELLPARLLEEIDERLLQLIPTDDQDKKFNPLGAVMRQAAATTVDATLLRDVLQERGFSATSLNNYLKSPWDYFFRNVLRIPETQPIHMQFGTAMHAVLEYVTRIHTSTGTAPSDSDIRKKLEQALHKLPINAEEYSRLFEKGLEALMVYVPHMLTTLPKETREEFKIRVHLETGVPELPELVLTGNLDRIDIGENGYASRVVDYKTGKPKSRNVIEGNTKDADGGYKRQLVFYALLLSLHDDDRFKTKTGVLSFIEPVGHTVKEEVFLIGDDEIEALKQTIIGVVREIISGSFLSVACEEGDTEYYELVERWQK